MIEARTKGAVVSMVWILVVAVACTVGEVRPGTPGPSDEPTPTEPGEAPREVEAEDAAVETYRATDLLMRSQLAYEAANLEEALSLAEQVIADHPGSVSVEPARWVGARAAFALGRYEQAEEMALAYADRQPSGFTLGERARELARLAEDARSSPAEAPPVIGAILPRSGPNVLVRYGDWVLEGIELAVAEVERQQGRPIDLVVADDSGGTRTWQAVAELEAQGALAVIGPLMPRQLSAAADARRDPRLVLISPTASATSVAPATYSVSAGDTRGAQELGRFAADVGFRQAAVLHARNGEYEEKARAFAVEYEALGGTVRARVPYDSGTTTFGPHMTRILDAVAPSGTATTERFDDRWRSVARDTAGWQGRSPQRPFALFVAAPQEDVPKIAPQVAFYDLDSAGVQLLGDEAWATAEVRRVVPGRDLEGVIATSYFPPDRSNGTADPEFVEAYEARYRRSLDNPLPALGYDAANLVLQALPNRLLTPDALGQRFRFLAGIRGATGMLSVRAGRVVRTPYLVTVHGGQLEPAPYPWEYEMPEPLPPTPPDTDEGGERRR